MLGTILIIILILLLIGAFPAWPHSRSWGYWPSSTVGLVVVIVVILVLMGQIWQPRASRAGRGPFETIAAGPAERAHTRTGRAGSRFTGMTRIQAELEIETTPSIGDLRRIPFLRIGKRCATRSCAA